MNSPKLKAGKVQMTEDLVEVGMPENVAHKLHVRSDLEWNGEDPFSIFQLSDKLGEGSFGSVWKVVTKDQGKRETALAIKQIILNEETDIEDIENEISILKECKSPFIVSYYGVFRLGNIMWILMDNCGLGSVADIIDVNGKPLNEKACAWIVNCALQGLSYLHSLKIVHRDVKGGNILVAEDASIKLADFGVSEKLEKIVGELAGTPLWMAPEVARKVHYDHRADIWSLGVTMIEIIDGEPPMSDFSAFRVMMAIQKNDPPTVKNPKQMSQNFLDFLSRCLVKDPNKRWETKEALSHSYLAHSKQEHIKDILKKTQKNQKLKKIQNTPKIDHSDINKKAADDTVVLPLDIKYGEEQVNDSISTTLQHDDSSVNVLPLVTPPESPTPLWAQPGYGAEEEGDSCLNYVQVVDPHSPSHSSSTSHSTISTPVLLNSKTPDPVTLDFTTPRVSVTEQSTLLHSEKEEPCCRCTIL